MNNKGFTIVELIITFVIVMTICLGLFATVDAYREKQQQESYRKDLNSYRNEIVKVIQDDVLKLGGIKGIEPRYVLKKGDSCYGFNQGITITFRNGTEKRVCYGNGNAIDLNEDGEITQEEIEQTNGLLYDNVFYKKPSVFVQFVDDYMFVNPPPKYRLPDGGLEKTFWSINIRLIHTEVDDDFYINIVSTQPE